MLTQTDDNHHSFTQTFPPLVLIGRKDNVTELEDHKTNYVINCLFWSVSAGGLTAPPLGVSASAHQLALVPPSSLRELGFSLSLAMSLNELLSSLIALLLLLWRGPFVLNSAWFWKKTSRRTVDEEASLLQLAEAFARKLGQERPLIAERINHPETIRNVSRSRLHSQANLNPNSAARSREGPFSRLPLLSGDAQSS